MFCIRLEVRDYECDLQGVVNNANYLRYMEHARHRFLLAHGLDFGRLAEEGVDLMLTRVEVDFRRSLRPGDVFDVTVAVERISRLKFCFVQRIVREDGELMAEGRNYGVAVRAGRPFRLAALERLIESSAG